MAEPWVKFQLYEGLLVHVEMDSSSPTQETFRTDMLDMLQKILDNQQPFTLVVDSSKLGTVPMSIPLDIVKFMKLNRCKFRDYCKASAIIVNSTFIKGLLDWVFTLSPPVSPNVVCKDVADAFKFVEARMNVAGDVNAVAVGAQ
jgi:hypothetical protein